MLRDREARQNPHPHAAGRPAIPLGPSLTLHCRGAGRLRRNSQTKGTVASGLGLSRACLCEVPGHLGLELPATCSGTLTSCLVLQHWPTTILALKWPLEAGLSLPLPFVCHLPMTHPHALTPVG